MKIINRIFFVIISIIILGCKARQYDSSIRQPNNIKFQNTDSLKQIIFKGGSVEISVEKIIYSLSPDNNDYYLKFIIKNISNKRKMALILIMATLPVDKAMALAKQG